ncbi:MAG: thioether cross-link-forming SCIFF peptide maturase [Alkaliphilus sp.]
MIHKFTKDNTNILIDVNSGAVHVVDELVYKILDSYEDKKEDEIVKILSEKFNRETILEGIKEIDELVKSNLLFTKERYLEHESFKSRKPVVKALCLHISHDCNIRCQYCFASQGDFKGQRMLMDFDTGKKAIDFLIDNSGSRKNLEVDFFGGEPLMNFKVVKQLVSYARSKEKEQGKNLRFTITTNALSLNKENMKYINDNMHNVVLSIDGRESVNDKMRSTVTGEGTYNLIIGNIVKMAELRKDKNYYVRGTFTRHNLDFAHDVLHLADLGIKSLSIEPVVASPEHNYSIREEDLTEVFKSYDYLAEQYVKREKEGNVFSFFHYTIDLEQGPCVIKRIVGCGAGAEYLAITPEGDIYPCHQFVGDTNFKIGSVHTGEISNKLYDEFSVAHVYNKEKCSGCWAKFYCSGGCHANAYNFNKDINIPYEIGCEMEKKQIECALWVKAVQMEAR